MSFATFMKIDMLTDRETLCTFKMEIDFTYDENIKNEYHSWRTNEPSILFSISMDSGGIVKGENMSTKLEAGAGLNSYGPPFTPQTCNTKQN